MYTNDTSLAQADVILNEAQGGQATNQGEWEAELGREPLSWVSSLSVIIVLGLTLQDGVRESLC